MPANAGRSSHGEPDTPGPAWLRSSFSDNPVSEIAQPREPTPEEFGISAARIKYFRGVLEDDPVPIAAFGLPIVAISIFGINWLLPRSLVDFISPLWRYSLPVIPAAYVIGAIQRKRKSAARKQPDYTKFSSYQTAMENYGNAMKTYRYLLRKDRYDAVKRKRQEAAAAKQQRQAKWIGIDGRDFEVEVVKILFSKGYDVSHTGGSSGGDEGVDFVVRFDSKRIIGQCKAHSSYVSAGPVRELYGTLIHEKAEEAWLVVTTGFYSGAKSFASGKPIRLLTIHDVLRLPDVERNASGKFGEQSGVANGSQPIRAETNRTSAAAASRRSP